MMFTSLIITTYNWPAALDRVLDSVARQRQLPDEVLIADDGSGSETRTVIESWQARCPAPVQHIWQADRGFRAARCRNRAIAACRGDYVILIDGDMVLHPRFIADHARLARPGSFLQGGRLKATRDESRRLLEGGRPVFAPWCNADFGAWDGTRRLYSFRQLWLARWKLRSPRGGRVMTCNASFWREDLVRVNGFDERMEGYGAEDRELAQRLENAGMRRRPLKWAALAVHLWHSTRAPEDVDNPELPNNRLFLETRAEGAVRCEHGLDRHLAHGKPEFAD